MGKTGFEPALVVETSPDNFQLWLNHGRVLSDRFLSTLVAGNSHCAMEEIAGVAIGDISAAWQGSRIRS
jgi:hypothetical protein